MSSGQESYCREHKNELARAIRHAGKSPEVITTERCQRLGCENTFEVSSWGQAQRYCGPECRAGAPKAARLAARQVRQERARAARAALTERICPGLSATESEVAQLCCLKPIGDFYLTKGEYPDTICKVHRNLLIERSRKKDPVARREQARRSARKNRMAKYHYLDLETGEKRTMTESDFDHEFLVQQGRCKIPSCGFEFSERAPDVDHDHDTMWFRGLLCHGCNLSIHARHSAAWHRDVATYLESSRATVNA